MYEGQLWSAQEDNSDLRKMFKTCRLLEEHNIGNEGYIGIFKGTDLLNSKFTIYAKYDMAWREKYKYNEYDAYEMFANEFINYAKELIIDTVTSVICTINDGYEYFFIEDEETDEMAEIEIADVLSEYELFRAKDARAFIESISKDNKDFIKYNEEIYDAIIYKTRDIKYHYHPTIIIDNAGIYIVYSYKGRLVRVDII
jgi:hypothetical protein